MELNNKEVNKKFKAWPENLLDAIKNHSLNRLLKKSCQDSLLY